MTAANVLIVDDEADIRALIEITLSRMGLRTQAAANVREARQRLDEQSFDLCITDMRLPDGDGLELIAHIQKLKAPPPVAVLTAYGSAQMAVDSLKAGAFDFVSKPVDLQALRKLVDTALKLRATPPTAFRSSDTPLLGESPLIQQLRVMVEKLARSQAPVHIFGESGTGKELVARLIHQRGPRSSAAFVPVNCGAIPSELMESEFFGHRKGSFTGALKDKPGLFQAAEGGHRLRPARLDGNGRAGNQGRALLAADAHHQQQQQDPAAKPPGPAGHCPERLFHGAGGSSKSSSSM